MTVALLKVELRKGGLSTVVNKPIIGQRLLDALSSNVSIRTDADMQMYPNHKIDPILLQILFAFTEAWDAGSYIAGD